MFGRSFTLFFFATFLSMTFTPRANAADDERYVWTGEITREKLNQFKSNLAENKQLRSLEFRDSVGASGEGGLLIEEIDTLIRTGNLNTYARGMCASACAVSFLLGTERTMILDGKHPTVLMLHPARSRADGQRNSGLTEKLNHRIIEKSGGRISGELLEHMFDAVNPIGGIYIGATPVKFGEKSVYVLFCRGDELPGFQRCLPFYDITPQQLGINIQLIHE